MTTKILTTDQVRIELASRLFKENRITVYEFCNLILDNQEVLNEVDLLPSFPFPFPFSPDTTAPYPLPKVWYGTNMVGSKTQSDK